MPAHPTRAAAVFIRTIGLTLVTALGCARTPAVDVILTDGKIFTSDDAQPWVEAIAVRGDRIVAVGKTSDIEGLAGPETRRIALDGRTVVPGFDDAHAHVGLSGPRAVDVVVDPSPTPDPTLASLLDSIRVIARRTPPDRWITAGVGARVLDDPRAVRATLDAAAPGHAVMLTGWSGHGAILNTRALREAGLVDVPDPIGGWITRNAAGQPTGRIDEYALYATQRRLGKARGDSLFARSVQRYGEQVLPMGITSVQDMTVGYDLAHARAVVARGGVMQPRHRVIRFPIPRGASVISDDWRIDGADTVLAPTMHVSGVKWVLDGTPVEALALMREPYANRPGWYGRANFPYDTLRAILRDALQRREQPMLHAVGDSTIALVIRAMRAEAPDSVWRALRPRLEHADGLGRDQLADLRQLGMIVVQNPAHLAIPPVMTARWGAARLQRVDLLRTLLDSGVTLAIGSDGPLEPGLNVMLATLHPNVPGEALSREQAVVAYTRTAAFAAFAEKERGSLAVGKLADLVVLSQDLFSVPPDQLPATKSVLTMLNGVVVHDQLTAPRP
jgi:predicted amidohydrolase YtcJ